MLSLEGGVSNPARVMQNRVSPTCAHMQPGHLPEFCGSLFASCPDGKGRNPASFCNKRVACYEKLMPSSPRHQCFKIQTVFGCWNLKNSTLAYIAGETRPAYGPSRVMVSDFMTCRIPSSTYLVRVRWQPTLYYHTTMI